MPCGFSTSAAASARTTVPCRSSWPWPSGLTPKPTASSLPISRSSPSQAGSWSPGRYGRRPVIGKAERNGKRCYYIDDGVYHTFSGILFDHCKYPLKAFKQEPTEICSVFGPTCDALDTLSLAEELPDLELGDLVYSQNIGAYSHASSTSFNGFPPAKVIHINQAADVVA